MIYLDYGATSFPKPAEVTKAVERAMKTCANSGRGGYEEAMRSSETVYRCRETAGKLFSCEPEQVVMTGSCTMGLNMAIASLFERGNRVVISGFEHNAVTRTLQGRGIRAIVAGRKLFDWKDTLEKFRSALDSGADGAVFTHVSNVFGYILPVYEMAGLCRERHLPFIVDAAQSAGTEKIDFRALGADFIAMPGHKGLLGPMGTGLLLCKKEGKPLLLGGTGTRSREQTMPDFLPEQMEAGTLNIPGIAGLTAGMKKVLEWKPEVILRKEQRQVQLAGNELKKMGVRVFMGPHQAGTLSMVPPMDCEELAALLAREKIAVRAGLHCAPLAHESAGTLDVGTLRLSYGPDAEDSKTWAFLQAVSKGLS